MHLVDVQKAVEHVRSCANFDGGYGLGPGAESHSGQIFTCVGALSIAGRLDLVDVDRLGGWLSERQLSNGGLNGRPQKLEDVCYSWWVMSSLAMIDRLHWIDADKLSEFILRCQVGCTSCRAGVMLTLCRIQSLVVLLIGRVTWLTSSIPFSVSPDSACSSTQALWRLIPDSESFGDVRGPLFTNYRTAAACHERSRGVL